LDQFWSWGVKLGLVRAFGHAVEVGEEINLRARLVRLRLFRPADQVINEHFGVDLFLDIKGRGVDDEVAPILLILAAPDELGIKVGVARILHLAGRLLLFLNDGLVLGSGDVFAPGRRRV